MSDNQVTTAHPAAAGLTITELVQLLASETGAVAAADSIDDSTTFEDIGVDSLGLLGVITAIERGRGVNLPEESQQLERVTEFVSMVNDNLRKVG
ncbi:acyl carrier protein [Micromonospora carbonacea]|uniref:Minimal PKS acyl carrier protein n=1 Tax=Micromonospora carbonacea TaxID=47853 RepID=A0A1C4VE39_9ACTN|nr:acyl carrier protein [Micromonospora carbonacea]SCE82300.1 minimal PKS acyl carrier protein [Micromonospora carbonacea]